MKENKLMKKILCAVMCVGMAASLAACGGKADTKTEAAATEAAGTEAAGTEAAGTEAAAAEATGEKVTLSLAYQYGLAYAPLIVAQQNQCIEEAYKAATGNEVAVNWIQMSSGADINTGIAAGEIQVGFMGLGPAITGVAKNVGYKIFTNLSGQEHSLMVNDPEITCAADMIGTDKQIAVVNIGSFQHMILAMGLAAEGQDPHALDSNLIAMKHPDGMTSLTTGQVAGHVTTSPYLFTEQGDETLHSIDSVANAWTADNSFIVGVAATKLYNEDPELYTALCDGIKAAMDFINADPAATAAMTCEFNGNSVEDETAYLQRGKYVPETKGIGEFAKFMYENAFVEVDPGEYKDIVFDNVVGD